MELCDLWAKTEPRQSVVAHGIAAGMVSQCAFDHYLSESDRNLLSTAFKLPAAKAKSFLAYIVSLHDIGKIEYHFQACDPETLERLKGEKINYAAFGEHHYRHELTGKAALARIWQNRDEDDDAVDVYAAIVGAHHQKNSGEGCRERQPVFQQLQSEFEETMRDMFWKDEALPIITNCYEGTVEALLLGVVILSDWIASGEMFADCENWIHGVSGHEAAYQRGLEFLKISGLLPEEAAWKPTFTEIWPWIPKAGIRPVQHAIEQLVNEKKRCSLVLIEAPMGEGKTEAGMYAAVQLMKSWGKDGFYAALPTAATSNQMVDRLRSWFEVLNVPKTIRLLHGMAWLTDTIPTVTLNTEENEEAQRWLAPVKRGLLSQFAVGTIDQVMMSVAKTKFGVLRLLGLSNKVLVIDEIHSYDVYMGEFIIRLLEWCKALQIPVVMLSATLPPALKKKLLKPYTDGVLSGGYPLITAITENGEVAEIPVKETTRKQNVNLSLLPILNDPIQIAHTAAEMAENGGCICVLMNTIGEAQAVYSELEKCFDGDRLLFHARFPAERRNEIEKECLRKFGKDKSYRPKKAVLVATQVVEQSLDVDFDYMLTAIAPIDLLLQRMGRVHRHDETVRPKGFETAAMGVLVPEKEDFGASSFVYPEVLLQQAVRVLQNVSEVRIPADLATLVAAGYDETSVPAAEAEKWLEKNIEDQIKAGQSLQYLINPPEKMLTAIHRDIFFDDNEQSDYLNVKTRLGQPGIRIALLEPELYEQIVPLIQESDGKKTAPVTNKNLAKAVFGQSVSVSKRKIGKLSNLSGIYGAKLIEGIVIIPTERGEYVGENGGTIINDPNLGVVIKEG